MKKKYNEIYLTNSLMMDFNESHSNIFSSLNNHILNNLPMENHIVLLIKSISKYYFKIRLHYITKRVM